jgi:hypothetical protein
MAARVGSTATAPLGEQSPGNRKRRHLVASTPALMERARRCFTHLLTAGLGAATSAGLATLTRAVALLQTAADFSDRAMVPG